MQLIIDDKRVEAKEGQTLLEVAQENGIEIPTLCHHEALEPRGACRLCIVEISNPKWPDWSCAKSSLTRRVSLTDEAAVSVPPGPRTRST